MKATLLAASFILFALTGCSRPQAETAKPGPASASQTASTTTSAEQTSVLLSYSRPETPALQTEGGTIFVSVAGHATRADGEHLALRVTNPGLREISGLRFDCAWSRGPFHRDGEIPFEVSHPGHDELPPWPERTVQLNLPATLPPHESRIVEVVFPGLLAGEADLIRIWDAHARRALIDQP